MTACQRCGHTLAADATHCTRCIANFTQTPQSVLPPDWATKVSVAQGKILRNDTSGDGILSIDGQQYPFSLERHWRSDQAPFVNMTVSATFSPEGDLLELRHVPEHVVRQERIQATLDTARTFAAETSHRALRSGMPIATEILAKVGATNVVALAALGIGWFSLNTLVIRVTSLQELGFSFFDVLRAINNVKSIEQLGDLPHASAGVYGLFAYVAVITAIVPFFFPTKRRWLGLCAPLAYMVIVGVCAYMKVTSSLSTFMGNEIAREMTHEVLRAVSTGIGCYVSLAAALYLTLVGLIRSRQA